jgi:hypothetical protein
MPCDEARDIIGIDPQYSKVKYMDPYRIYENVWNSTYFQTNSCGIIWTDPPKNFAMRSDLFGSKEELTYSRPQISQSGWVGSITLFERFFEPTLYLVNFKFI